MVDTQIVKDIIQSLIKARKNIRLYPDNNPLSIRTIDEIHSKLTAALKQRESVTISIRQYEILFDDQIVYSNKRLDDSLALFLFKDGIRELSFLKGIRRNETKEFLKIISSDFETKSLDEDIVTLLWTQDFEHIHYIVDDTYLLDDENYAKTAIGQVKDASGGPEEIMKAYNEALEAEKGAKISLVPLTDADLGKIIRDIENDTEDKTVSIVSILLEIFNLAQNEKEYDEITKNIAKVLDFALSQDAIEPLILALVDIKSAIEHQVYAKEVNASLKQIEYYVNSSRFIKLLADTLDRGVELSEELVAQLSSLLNRKAIPGLITILGELKRDSARKAVVNILSNLGKNEIPALAKGLDHEKWYVVKDIISILKRIGDRQAVEHLIRVLQHPDSRVRKNAVQTLGKLGSEAALQALVECMSDADESVRVAAIRSIGFIGTPTAKKIFLDKLGERRLTRAGFLEKRTLFEMLAGWKEDDVIQILTKLVKKRVWFKRAKFNETKAAAVYCLGLIGEQETVHVLEELRSTRSKTLRDNVEAAISRIKRE
jgi:HEAT repeat protein